ncbi:MAG: hypothetical protein KGL53_07185, partial [Elusimicrobia bacterium]|nr:hypothetical protein [Elusimicrobiota bacterium]
ARTVLGEAAPARQAGRLWVVGLSAVLPSDAPVGPDDGWMLSAELEFASGKRRTLMDAVPTRSPAAAA